MSTGGASNVVSTSYTTGITAPINFRGSGRLADGTTRCFIMQDVIAGTPTATLYTSPDGLTWTSKVSWAVGTNGVTPTNMRLSFVVDDLSNIHVIYFNWATTNPSLSYIKLSNASGVFTAGTAINCHSAVASRVVLAFDIDLVGNSSSALPVISLSYQSTAVATQPTIEYQIIKSGAMSSLYTQTNTINNIQTKSFISGCKTFESDGHSAYFVTCRFSTTGTSTLEGSTVETVLVLVNTSTPAVTSQTRADFQPFLAGRYPDQVQIFNVAAREVSVLATSFGSTQVAISRFSYANNLTPAITKSYIPVGGTVPSFTVEAGTPLKAAIVDNNFMVIFFVNSSTAGSSVFCYWTVSTLGSVPSYATFSSALIQFQPGSPTHGGGTSAYAGPYDFNTSCNRNVDFGVHDPDLIVWSDIESRPFF